MIVVLSIEIVDETSYRNFGGLCYDDGIEVVEDVLGLDCDDVGGFQRIGTNNAVRTLHFSISDTTFYRNCVQNGLYKRSKLSSGKIVTVGEPNLNIKEIYVRYAPLEWEDARFIRIFRHYGDIKGMEHQRIKSHETKHQDYVGKRNGITIIRIKLRRQIPSCMHIDNRRIEVFYANQIRTCFRCGGGHNRSECNTSPTEFTNKFSFDDDFPELVATVMTNSARRQAEDEMEDSDGKDLGET